MCGKHPLMGPEGQQRVELRQWQLVSASLPSERRPHWVALRTFVAPVDLRYPPSVRSRTHRVLHLRQEQSLA